MYVLARSYGSAEDSGRSEAPILKNGKHLLVNAITNRLQNLLGSYVSSRVDRNFNDHVASHTRRKFRSQHMRIWKGKRQRRPRSPIRQRSMERITIPRAQQRSLHFSVGRMLVGLVRRDVPPAQRAFTSELQVARFLVNSKPKGRVGRQINHS